jgi:hypothetical protein
MMCWSKICFGLAKVAITNLPISILFIFYADFYARVCLFGLNNNNNNNHIYCCCCCQSSIISAYHFPVQLPSEDIHAFKLQKKSCLNKQNKRKRSFPFERERERERERESLLAFTSMTQNLHLMSKL